MNLKERISDLFEKYSVELSVEDKEEPKEVAFATAVLESGQEIQTDADAFAVGVSVFVVNDENEQIPLPNGDYELQDGSILVVAEGAVSEIKEAEAPAEEAAEEVEEVEASVEAITREDVASMIAEAVAEAKKEFSSQIEERDAKITELSKQTSKTISRAPKMEAPVSVDLKSLSITERVAAIHNQFSK